jgi:DNA-binding HxlR family transcriptional regulator
VGARRYNQHCALAKSLDVLGDRWTLLVVRELLDGPKRYVDLMDGLVTIPTDTLAARLRHLEQHGLVARRRLAPPADRPVYDLTEAGRSLEDIVDAYVRWGRPLIEQRDRDDVVRPEWLARAVRSQLPRHRPGVDLTLALRTPETTATLRITDDAVEMLEPDAPADVVLAGPVEDLAAALDPARAGELVTQGRLTVEGSAAHVRVMARLLGDDRAPDTARAR